MPWQIVRTQAHRQALVEALGEAAFAAAVERGKAMPLELAVEYALETE